jgi:hypothetical protein
LAYRRISKSNIRTFSIDQDAHPNVMAILEKWRREGVNVSDRISTLIEYYDREKPQEQEVVNHQ